MRLNPAQPWAGRHPEARDFRGKTCDNKDGPTGASTPAGPDHQSFGSNERGCG
jgi:hypothetical protein